MLQLEPSAESVKLANIRVAPAYQRRGIGARLITTVLRDAHERGQSVTLDVFKVNPARFLYERLGFLVVGETETRLLMEARPRRDRNQGNHQSPGVAALGSPHPNPLPEGEGVLARYVPRRASIVFSSGPSITATLPAPITQRPCAGWRSAAGTSARRAPRSAESGRPAPAGRQPAPPPEPPFQQRQRRRHRAADREQVDQRRSAWASSGSPELPGMNWRRSVVPPMSRQGVAGQASAPCVPNLDTEPGHGEGGHQRQPAHQ